ncbi:acetoin dehydrogenase [Lentithecium fluviatile CBS 122367]|uniref:Acetoin dehydrogenase n=1 Tax=Lentithecium fluviatile CBS 122367 TaxID=1168545 RepID=A0A6G1JA00_9PLEO|nr:acetoin dehydrogenase [Lentithecium fluviatile CBS 122367]
MASKPAAIVTGSGRGIGESIVYRLAEEGFSICVNDISSNQAAIDTVVDNINTKFGQGTAIGVAADVSSSDEVKRMIDQTVQQLGPLRVMIANAGIAQVASALDLTPEDFTRIFNVNVLGVFNCYVHAARQMIAQGPVVEDAIGYRILGAASIASFKPFALLSHYCMSKGAVRSFTQTFAIEMARHKITVNCYAPGIVGTAMWDEVDEKLGELEGRPRGESLKKYSTDLTAMGRVSVPEDVSKVVGGFLCSRDSDFVTGQTLVVDGGIVFT